MDSPQEQERHEEAAQFHVLPTPDREDEADSGATTAPAKSSGPKKEPADSAGALAVQLAENSEIELFHTADHEPYATYRVHKHKETWALASAKFKRWLAQLYYKATGEPLNDRALKEALNILEARALFDGEEQQVHLRVAEYEGAYYVDLVDRQWRVVKIAPGDWQVLDDSPVKFTRTKAMKALPVPERGGRIDELREFVNVDNEQWILVLSWLIAAFRPRGPYPVLILNGEQGSAKSTTARVLRKLFDPNTSPLRTKTRSEEDLMVTARNSHVLALDNISYLSPDLSDALCRISTGGGFSGRQRYTDTEETILNVVRPVLINGITDLIERSDLLQRSIILEAPRITSKNRRTEAEFWAAFKEKQPRILGALLSAVAAGLLKLPTTHLAELPRMADFATWASACEEALGFVPGTFISTYHAHLREGSEAILAMSPIVPAVLKLLNENHGNVEFTPTEMRDALNDVVDPETRRQSDWPKSVTKMSAQLKRLAPNLREIGVEHERAKTKGTNSRRVIKLKRVPAAHTTGATAAPTKGAATEPAEDDSELSEEGDDLGFTYD